MTPASVLILGRLVVGLVLFLIEVDAGGGLGLVEEGLGLVDEGLGLVEEGLGLVEEGLGLVDDDGLAGLTLGRLLSSSLLK
jgi:hypothetical protein